MKLLEPFAKKMRCKRGSFGGGTTVQAAAPPPPPPAAPSPGETAEQSIQAQLDAIPKQLAAEQEFGPQFIQESLDQSAEFGPQFLEQGLEFAEEFGPRLSKVTRAEQDALDPSRGLGGDAIADFLRSGGDTLTDIERDTFLQDIRAAQQTRGLAQSGFGAVAELEQVTGLRQSLKDRFLNVALSASGRLPSAGGSSVAAPGFGNQGLIQNVNPATFFSGQAAQNQSNAGIFGTQTGFAQNQNNNATAQRGQNIGFISDVIGGVAGGVGSFVGAGGTFCWVANEVFGSWNHPDVTAMRFWMLFKAPKWLRNGYARFGQRIATFISDKPILKAILKPLFKCFAARGRA